MATTAVRPPLDRTHSCGDFGYLVGKEFAVQAAALSASPTQPLPEKYCVRQDPPSLRLGPSTSVPVTKQEAAGKAAIVTSLVESLVKQSQGQASSSERPPFAQSLLAAFSSRPGQGPTIGGPNSSFIKTRHVKAPFYPPVEDPRLVDQSRGERIDTAPPTGDLDVDYSLSLSERADRIGAFCREWARKHNFDVIS